MPCMIRTYSRHKPRAPSDVSWFVSVSMQCNNDSVHLGLACKIRRSGMLVCKSACSPLLNQNVKSFRCIKSFRCFRTFQESIKPEPLIPAGAPLDYVPGKTRKRLNNQDTAIQVVVLANVHPANTPLSKSFTIVYRRRYRRSVKRTRPTSSRCCNRSSSHNGAVSPCFSESIPDIYTLWGIAFSYVIDYSDSQEESLISAPQTSVSTGCGHM